MTNPTHPSPAQIAHSDFDAPMLARARTDSPTSELRGECPRWVLNVLDAVSMAEDKTRTALVNEILGQYAKKKIHEATLIHRIAGVNPHGPEAVGG